MKTIDAGYAYKQTRILARTRNDWKGIAEEALKLYGQYMCIPENELHTDYVKFMIIQEALARNYIVDQLNELDGIQ